MTRKEITDAFNSLSLDARKEYLEALKAESKTQYDKFIKDLGDQAVQDFWDNERELIKQGKGTRNWTDVSSFCPIRRYFLPGDKNSIPYHAADSHAAAFSTGSLSLRYTALILPITVYDIYFYFRMERIL